MRSVGLGGADLPTGKPFAELHLRGASSEPKKHGGKGTPPKQSGMFWTVRGANAIVALRCCYHNGRFEDYWEDRRAA